MVRDHMSIGLRWRMCCCSSYVIFVERYDANSTCSACQIYLAYHLLNSVTHFRHRYWQSFIHTPRRKTKGKEENRRRNIPSIKCRSRNKKKKEKKKCFFNDNWSGKREDKSVISIKDKKAWKAPSKHISFSLLVWRQHPSLSHFKILWICIEPLCISLRIDFCKEVINIYRGN